jgi:hypothetical protein
VNELWQRLRECKKVAPQTARLMAFDGHLVVPHCEPRFVEQMRSLKGRHARRGTDTGSARRAE